jgi:hypothetical protein
MPSMTRGMQGIDFRTLTGEKSDVCDQAEVDAQIPARIPFLPVFPTQHIPSSVIKYVINLLYGYGKAHHRLRGVLLVTRRTAGYEAYCCY